MGDGMRSKKGIYGPVTAARRALHRTLSAALARLTAPHDYDLENTLVVAGAPRSGTTWLAEMLSTIPRSAILFEPEHVRHVAKARAAGVTWHAMKLPGEKWEKAEEFFANVLSGHVITPWTVSHLPLSRALSPRIWIVKFVDANLFLGWLGSRYPVRRPILLMRHPCAVVASQLRRGWELRHPPRIPRFFAMYPEFTSYVDSLRSPLEFTTALWCIRHYGPLALPRPRSFAVVTYEELVIRPMEQLSRMFDDWGIPIPAELERNIHKLSGTTDRGSLLFDGAGAVDGWRRQLSAADTTAVLEVVRRFGLSFYSDDPMPDLQAVATWQPSSSASCSV